MTTEDILRLRDLGEVSKVQFKERILDKYDIGCELVAMSNFRGGQLVIGINDKTGEFNPLSYAGVQETTNLLGNIASENVVPSILLDIDTASVAGGSVVVATIKEGNNKPYHDNKGIVWIKNWADKRKVFDNRVEIHSPGILPNGLQVEDITNGTSMPRNNFLFSNAIYLLPYTGAGTGIQRALEDGLQVEFKNDERTHEFLITIARKENLDTDPDTFEADSDTNSDTSRANSDTLTPDSKADSDTRRMKLTPKQRDVVNFCSVPRSSREILERAGVTYHSKNIHMYIKDLVEAGYLEMTNPNNPNASNQKYRKK